MTPEANEFHTILACCCQEDAAQMARLAMIYLTRGAYRDAARCQSRAAQLYSHARAEVSLAC